MRRDLTRRETPRVQRQHNLIDVTKTTLPFLHNRRAKRALPIPGDSDLHLTHRVRDHRLRPTTIADIRRLAIRISVVLLVSEMLGHLLVQRGFQHGFREQLQTAHSGRSGPSPAPAPGPSSPPQPPARATTAAPPS